MIKEGKEKREKSGSAVIKTEPSVSQAILPEATVKEEPGTESHVNGGEEGNAGGGAASGSGASSNHLDLKPSGLIGSTNAGTLGPGRGHPSATATGDPSLSVGDGTQETKHEESSSQDKPPLACGIVKTELNGSTSHEFSDRLENLPSSSGPPPNGIQPLPSNVINKQPGTMEAQYMQQQSQIFVFSTSLANKSAEAVLQGQFPSIIAYHCAQPGTKKYLEKHPLKMNQFNRQNPAQWLNNLAQLKQKMIPSPAAVLKGLDLPGGFQGSPHMMPEGGPPGPQGQDMWNQNNNMINSGMSQGGNGMQQPPCAPNANAPVGPNAASTPNSISQGCNLKESPCVMPGDSPGSPPAVNLMQPLPSPGSEIVGSPSNCHGHGTQPGPLAGVKVPDENLTPQQRQHREEQLARLRNMQQMLFPEQQSPGSGPPPEGPDGAPMVPMGPMMGPAGQMMTQKGMMMGGIPGSNQITPTSVAAQIEWQKLQHQFYEERKKKGASGLGMGGVGSPTGNNRCGRAAAGSGPRTQGPPPPYHQTPRSASVPTAMPSPSPGSPNDPTSNLSLPSPRAASALDSPAEPGRQFPGRGSALDSPAEPGRQFPGRGSGPSPTSQDSPSGSRPLNASNPGTPGSARLSPSATRKDSSQNCSDFSSASSQANGSQQPPADGMFCRTLQTMAQKQLQQPHPSKEPNLMPVPSPQQIQYLNTFEGQELTIQKQPNTSLKDANARPPSVPPSSLDGSLQTGGPGSELANPRMSSCPGTPLTPTSLINYPPTSSDLTRFPIPSPLTPNSGSNENKGQRFPGQSPQSQGSRAASMDSSLNKTPTNEAAGHFLSTSPQLGDGMGPPRFSGGGSGSPAMLGQPSNFMGGMGGMPGPPHFLEVSPGSGQAPNAPPGGMDVSPTGAGGFPTMRTENVPLNPNGTMACNGKSAHFDPISSMAQMSQQLTSSVTNSPGPHSAGGMMGAGMPGAGGAGPGPGMMPFNAPGGIHPGMQMSGMESCQGIQDPGQVPQPGPGNFANMQMQNVGQPHSYSPNPNVGGMIPCSMGGGTGVVNQPSIHTNCTSPKPGNMMMGNAPSFPGAGPMGQRMMNVMGRPPGPSPYNGANVQVKASAPNTIQYLPAKPQTSNSGPRGPLSLEFLQRFTNPLPNLDTKVPTHNLQYFPNNNQQNMPGHPGQMNRQPNGIMGGMNNAQMVGMPGGPNCPPGPNHGGHMGGMNGPMMGPNGSIGGVNVPMSGGMIMGPGGPGIGLAPLRGSLRPGGMMRMQQMGGGMFGVPPNQPGGPDQMFGVGPNPNMPGGGGGNFVPGSKASPMGLGNAPDASQPLPPSMGQSNNFKNSPFIGPTTADPNYAQQFHNFQQQLYATNTRSQMNNQAIGPNQSFFVPK